jgi:peptidoglycan/LPS O-acetylase OafA/YrhL
VGRNLALDVLKVVLALMVVALHSRFLADVSPLATFLTVDGLFRIAVPIFFLISGFYFYPAVMQGRHWQWIGRIILLYAFWMLFYAYFWFRPTSFSLAEILRMAGIMLGGYYHLWYMVGIIGSALLLMLIRHWPVRYLLLLGLSAFLLGVAIQYTALYYRFSEPAVNDLLSRPESHRNILLLAFPFFCGGFLIGKSALHERLGIRLPLYASIVGIALLVLEAYLNYDALHQVEGIDNLLALLIACPALFVLIINLDVRGNIPHLAQYSTAIYFVHVFFLFTFLKFFSFTATLMTLAVLLASLLASYVLVRASKRFRFIL